MNKGLEKREMKKWILTLLTIFCVLFTLSTRAWSESVTCPDVADVYIDEWYPYDNFNYKTRLLMATNTNLHHGIARALLQFDIPSELEPGNIASASIYFSPCASCGGGDGGWMGFYALNAPFDEAVDTWDSLQGGSWDETVFSTAVLPGGTDWNQAVNGTPPPDAESMDVTTLLKGNLAKAKQNGIMMRFLDEHQSPPTWQNLASRESEDPLDFHPFIVLEVQALTCSTWFDVIAKYNIYTSGGVVWMDVITCYTQYLSQP